MKHRSSINLIKQKEKSFIDKFIDWAITVGRLVVIITEAIALAAFLYRFSLDRQLIDLHEAIDGKQDYLTVLKSNEDIYRNLQERLSMSATLDKQASNSRLLEDIYALTPPDLILNKLTISQHTLSLEADTPSVSSLSTFITSLKTHKRILAVNINKIENKISSAIITVGISAGIN